MSLLADHHAAGLEYLAMVNTEVIPEVRRQFRERPGILAGTEQPSYRQCVDIVTAGALKQMVSLRRKVCKGENLFRTGESFSSLYAVKTGTFKTLVNNQDGSDQVIVRHISQVAEAVLGIVRYQHVLSRLEELVQPGPPIGDDRDTAVCP